MDHFLCVPFLHCNAHRTSIRTFSHENWRGFQWIYMNSPICFQCTSTGTDVAFKTWGRYRSTKPKLLPWTRDSIRSNQMNSENWNRVQPPKIQLTSINRITRPTKISTGTFHSTTERKNRRTKFWVHWHSPMSFTIIGSFITTNIFYGTKPKDSTAPELFSYNSTSMVSILTWMSIFLWEQSGNGIQICHSLCEWSRQDEYIGREILFGLAPGPDWDYQVPVYVNAEWYLCWWDCLSVGGSSILRPT